MLRTSTGEDIDVIVMLGGRCNHQSMRMEGRGSHRRRSVAEETGVWLERRDWLAVVDIENLHTMPLGTAVMYVRI